MAVWTKTQGNQYSIFPKLSKISPKLKQNCLKTQYFGKTFLETGPFTKHKCLLSSKNDTFYKLFYLNLVLLWLIFIKIQEISAKTQANLPKTQRFSGSKLKKFAKTQFFGKSIHLLCRQNGQKKACLQFSQKNDCNLE